MAINASEAVNLFLGHRTRLVDVLPPEFLGGKYENSRAMTYAFVDVIATHRGEERPWPGDHKHVSLWYVLANGKAVGWNQHPQRGWSFPVITYELPLVAAAPLPFGEVYEEAGKRDSQMAEAEGLAAVLEGTGLRFTTNDSGAWAIEGLGLTMLRRKAVKTGLLGLIAYAREHKLCVYFPIDHAEGDRSPAARIISGLVALGFHVLDDPALGGVIGFDARERVTVRVNQIQHSFHQLLVESGFSFEVGSDMVVGLEYKHPSKPISVLLKQVDHELEYVCLKPDGSAYEESDYTESEADWINDAPDEVERLRRELKARFERF